MENYAEQLVKDNSIFQDIVAQRETFWMNEKYLPLAQADALCPYDISGADIEEASRRLVKFAPYIRKCFPETEGSEGLIESPLREIDAMKNMLEEAYNCHIPGRLFLKMDSHLAIAGSVKARGGIYEVLKHAEELVLAAGLIREDESYERFEEKEIRDYLKNYTVQVGSTGNLGLSIGIMSAQLGFQVKVHMSADAKQWKKDLLRSKGVEVLEYKEDYSKAVAAGRKDSDKDPKSYFVDDEYSIPLFLGYAVAAERLKKQLDEQDIGVNSRHPLIVYIPCGVGGAPGGICYGLKRMFGDAVHVFFCEPTLFPSVLLGMATERYEALKVTDFGLGGISAADGLACGSPSGFVTRMDRHLLSGDFTVCDDRLFEDLKRLKLSEDILIEPSSCAAFIGPVNLMKMSTGQEYLASQGLTEEVMKQATHICWATGGSLVPDEMWDEYLQK